MRGTSAGDGRPAKRTKRPYCWYRTAGQPQQRLAQWPTSPPRASPRRAPRAHPPLPRPKPTPRAASERRLWAAWWHGPSGQTEAARRHPEVDAAGHRHGAPRPPPGPPSAHHYASAGAPARRRRLSAWAPASLRKRASQGESAAKVGWAGRPAAGARYPRRISHRTSYPEPDRGRVVPGPRSSPPSSDFRPVNDQHRAAAPFCRRKRPQRA